MLDKLYSTRACYVELSVCACKCVGVATVCAFWLDDFSKIFKNQVEICARPCWFVRLFPEKKNIKKVGSNLDQLFIQFLVKTNILPRNKLKRTKCNNAQVHSESIWRSKTSAKALALFCNGKDTVAQSQTGGFSIVLRFMSEC